MATAYAANNAIGTNKGGDPLDGQFETIKTLLYDTAGITLNEAKRELVRARISKRLNRLGGGSVKDYVAFVQTRDGRHELTEMVDVLTTNKTSFFRESAHFKLLTDLLEERGRRAPGMTLWSAGCSSGEEPYTIAMVLAEMERQDKAKAGRILATDLSNRVLDRARAAEYDEQTVAPVPDEMRRLYLTRGSGPKKVRVSPKLKNMVKFARLNLMGDWPMRGPFDAIFCRNVMIYFDAPTRETLVQRFEKLLAPGGYLCVGHSESITALSHGLEYIRPAVYRKDSP